MDRDERRELQLTRLRQLVDDVFDRGVGLFKRKLAEAGIESSHDIGSLSDLDSIPLTRKQDLRDSEAEHPPLGDYRFAPLDQCLRVGQSTGTTGAPTLTLLTRKDLFVEYESAVGDLSNGQNFTHHNAMVAAVDKLASAGLNAYKGAQSYKNDEAIMRAFLALVKDAKTYAYDKHARYKEAVETQVKINQDDMRGIFKVERLDTLIKEVVGLIKTPTKKKATTTKLTKRKPK